MRGLPLCAKTCATSSNAAVAPFNAGAECLVSTHARTEGVPLALVRTDALRAAGLIFAAVALGSLLKRKR